MVSEPLCEHGRSVAHCRHCLEDAAQERLAGLRRSHAKPDVSLADMAKRVQEIGQRLDDLDEKVNVMAANIVRLLTR